MNSTLNQRDQREPADATPAGGSHVTDPLDALAAAEQASEAEVSAKHAAAETAYWAIIRRSATNRPQPGDDQRLVNAAGVLGFTAANGRRHKQMALEAMALQGRILGAKEEQALRDEASQTEADVIAEMRDLITAMLPKLSSGGPSSFAEARQYLWWLLGQVEQRLRPDGDNKTAAAQIARDRAMCDRVESARVACEDRIAQNRKDKETLETILREYPLVFDD